MKSNKSSVQSNNNTEPEEGINFKNTRADGDIDPLNDEALKQSAKKNINIVGDRTKLGEEIPAAEHKAQQINIDEELQFEETVGEKPSGGGAKSGGGGGNNQVFDEQQFNSEFHEMPEDEQDESSLQTAIALVTMYAGVKLMIPKMIAISERRLKKMHKAGEIDMYMLIQVRRGSSERMQLDEFISSWNKKMIPPFETSEQFKQAVIPLLAKILKKNGLGLTDTQLLVMLVAQDFAQTVQHIGLAMGDRREMLETIRDLNPVGQKVNSPMEPVPGNPPASFGPIQNDTIVPPFEQNMQQQPASVTGNSDTVNRIVEELKTGKDAKDK